MTADIAEKIANKIMITVQSYKYRTVCYSKTRCDFSHKNLVDAVLQGANVEKKTVIEKACAYLKSQLPEMDEAFVEEFRHILEDET